jgi:hypothetical protein
MNKLILTLATAATVLGAGSTVFAPAAEAGMRIGFGFRHHSPLFRPHFYTPPTYYRDTDEDKLYIRRRKALRSKPQPEKYVEKKAVPLVKFADGIGRQFDPASKVWFDGRSQCFSGKQQFTFKNDSWFYGSSKWTEINGIWKTNSAEGPELVSCESVSSFAAKANAFTAKTANQGDGAKGVADQPKTPPAAVPKIKTAEGSGTTETAKAAPAQTECKKYFPSIGQMLVVPCGE